MPITPLPDPPSRSDPATFSSKADAFLGALPDFGTEANALAADVNADEIAAAASASAAAASALQAGQERALAEQAANAASEAANAAKWVSGTTYAEGDVVWSPTNFLLYRRKVAGAGTTDPAADQTNWALIGAPLSAPQQIISANTAAQTGVHYIFTAALTLTLPATPANRDTVQISNLSGSIACVVARNGANIMGLAEDLTIDAKFVPITLYYTDATRGWVF